MLNEAPVWKYDILLAKAKDFVGRGKRFACTRMNCTSGIGDNEGYHDDQALRDIIRREYFSRKLFQELEVYIKAI